MDKVKFIKPVEVDQLKVTGTINSSDIASQGDVTINTPDAKFSVGGPGFNYWHSKFGGIELHALEVGANEDGSDTGTIFAPYENSDDGEIYIANADRSKEAFLSTTEINLLKSEIGAKALANNKADKTVATSSADGLMSQRDKEIFDAFGFYTSGNYADMLATKNISIQAPEIIIDSHEKPIGISTEGKYTTVSAAEIVDMKNEIGAKSAVTTLETSRNAIIKKGSAEGSTISGGAYNGVNPAATAAGAHSEGGGTQAKSDGAHTEGVNTVAGRLSQADTTNTTKVAQIIAPAATKLGMPFSTTAEQQAAVLKLGGFGAHAEGFNTQALGTAAHAEGNATQALANSTHAEGDTTIAFGEASHAEGYNTKAKGNQSHAEGLDTQAAGNASHTEGRHTKTAAVASGAHAEGITTEANIDGAHSEGVGTKTTFNNKGQGQHVQGRWNVVDTAGDYAHIVGGGSSDKVRKNIHTVDWNGDSWFAGNVYVGPGKKILVTKEYVDSSLGSYINDIDTLIGGEM